MINPFTKKEIQGKTLRECFGFADKQENEQDKVVTPPNHVSDSEKMKLLEEKITQVEMENKTLKRIFNEITKPEVNSIAKIKSAIQLAVIEEEEA